MGKIKKYLGGGDIQRSATVILSAPDRRNTYQEKAPLEAKSVLQTCNASWHLDQVLSVGDPT